MKFSINPTFENIPKGIVRKMLEEACHLYYIKHIDEMEDGDEANEKIDELNSVFVPIVQELMDDSMFISEDGVVDPKVSEYMFKRFKEDGGLE